LMILSASCLIFSVVIAWLYLRFGFEMRFVSSSNEGSFWVGLVWYPNVNGCFLASEPRFWLCWSVGWTGMIVGVIAFVWILGRFLCYCSRLMI
jgi:hypothetical protein